MTYKILALDGGGFRGVLSAVILKEVQNTIQQELGSEHGLNDYFDLVAGTSTGSILATGIALGMDIDQLLNLYKNCGARIFPSRIRNIRKFTTLTRGFFPAFLYPHESSWPWQDEGLATVLKEQLQPTKSAILSQNYKQGSPVTINDIEKPTLLIPAYNTIKRRIDWFVSNNPSQKPMWYDNSEVWKFCVCSASAPTFFPPYQFDTKVDSSHQERTYIDGGVAANNPSLLAISHAMFLPSKNVEWNDRKPLELSDVSILSIGTGKPNKPFSYKEVKSWGLAQWAMRLGDLFIPAPNDVTDNVAWQLIRGNDGENAKRVLRLDLSIDDTKQSKDKELYQIDNPEFYDRYVQIASDYLDHGNVNFDIGSEKITPREAIHQFIKNNKTPW